MRKFNAKYLKIYNANFEICPEMHALAKMAGMAINRQTINKNSKGPFAKWRFWRKWQKWQLIAKIAKLYNKQKFK